MAHSSFERSWSLSVERIKFYCGSDGNGGVIRYTVISSTNPILDLKVKFLFTVLSISGVTASAIALGASHTCALITGGGLKCWGDNGRGQLGIGSTTRFQQTTPLEVSLGSGASHVCNLKPESLCVRARNALR
jgi:alpha-tubulin suppressor-like RCC1 family protein